MKTGATSIRFNTWCISILVPILICLLPAVGNTLVYDKQQVEKLQRLIKKLEPVKQAIMADHPGDNRPILDIVKGDIGFEQFVDGKLKDARLLVVGAWFDAKTLKLDKIQKKLAKYDLKIGPKGDFIYFTSMLPMGLPFVFPPQGQLLTFESMVKILDDVIAGNKKQLKLRQSQLLEMEKLVAYEKELKDLLRLGKTVDDLWIFDTDLEMTSDPTRFKILVGSELGVTIFVRYKDGTKEKFPAWDPPGGVQVIGGNEFIGETKDYTVDIRYSNNKKYLFTIAGYTKKDLFAFENSVYHIKEGPDAVVKVGMKRTGSGNGRVELRFKENPSKDLGYGDYAVIDPFPVWEDGETGTRYIRVKIEDNSENEYTKTLTLILVPSDKITLVKPMSTQIHIEDDDKAGEIKFAKPEYEVYESDKVVVIALERIGKTILESSQVRIRTRDGTARAGDDYTSLDTSFTWERKDFSNRKTVKINILEDTISENEETFQVILGDGSKASTRVRILEKELSKIPKQQRARFSSPRYGVDEAGGSVTVRVIREGGSKGRFSIEFYTQSAVARDGSDFHGVRQTLTWQDGDTTDKQVTISIIDDTQIEDPVETIHLQLENPFNPSFPVDYHPTATEAVIEIADNDGTNDANDDDEDDDKKDDVVFRARPECGNSFELAPGDFTGRSCGIEVFGVKSGTAGRVKVAFSFNKSRGLEIFPGNTSTPPHLIFTDPYTFAQTFRAKENASSGIVPVTVRVSQEGAGSVTFTIDVMILEKGQLPSSGEGIRPPVDMATGSNGTYCVWRYKLFGDPPECFHFAAAPCNAVRYRQSSYEMVGQNMTWVEADVLMSRLSRYQKDAYGCLGSLFPTKPDADGDGTPDDEDECDDDPNKQKKGQCGCNQPDTDRDKDGTADCKDKCPDDPKKIVKGLCGCGESDRDEDKDGVPDCKDECDDDPNKQKEGECGCHTPDVDKNGNGVMDCNEKKVNVTSMQISPSTATINVNGSASFSAALFDDQGKALSAQEASAISFDWAVNDPSVANISGSGPHGSVSPIKAGTITVMVTAASRIYAYAGVVIQPSDTDGDGIPDHRDKCQGTPAGTKVGSDGCPEKIGCEYDSECPKGYVCDSKTGNCVPPFDSDYEGFKKDQADREDQHSQNQSDQANLDQNAAGGKPSSPDDLGKDLDKIHSDVATICRADSDCPHDKICKDGICVDKDSGTPADPEKTSKPDTPKPDPAKPPTTPPPPQDPPPQDPVVNQDRSLKWHSSTVCSEAEGSDFGWTWMVVLKQTGPSVGGTVYYHKCPGGGRASYQFTGKANPDGSFSVNARRSFSRGPLANTAPQTRVFTLRQGSAPSPGI